jgi:hypothetical protein
MRSFCICVFLSLLLINNCSGQKYYGSRHRSQTPQKGYGQLAFSLYGTDEVFSVPGLSFGAGLLVGKNVTTGAGFDIYMFKNNGLRFSQAYADFRAYFAGIEKAGPFIAAQPGVMLIKNSADTGAESGFCMNVLGGYFVRLTRSLGITASLGYGLINYTVHNTPKRQNGIKFNVGICF